MRSWSFGHKNAINPTRFSDGNEFRGIEMGKFAWELEVKTHYQRYLKNASRDKARAQWVWE